MDLRSRSYVFTVALLAAIALGLFFFRPREANQVVETELTYIPSQFTSSDGVPIDPTATGTITANLLAEIRDPTFVQAAIDRGEIDLATQQITLEQLTSNISARVENQDGEPTRLRIRFRATDGKFGATVLDALANQFVAKHAPPPVIEIPPETEQKVAEARSIIQQWQNRCQSLLAQQRGMMKNELARLRNAHPASGVGSLLNKVAPKPAPGFRDRPQANPIWVKLTNELKTAQDEVAKMLETYTPEHPAVLLKLSDIEAIRQELQRTDRTRTGGSDQLANEDAERSTLTPYEQMRRRGLERRDDRDLGSKLSPDSGVAQEQPGSQSQPGFPSLELQPQPAQRAESESSTVIEPEPELQLQPPVKSRLAEDSPKEDLRETELSPESPNEDTLQQTTAPAPRVVAQEFDEYEARQTIVASEAYQQLDSKIKNAQEKLTVAENHLAELMKLLPTPPQRQDTQTDADEFAEVVAPARVVEVLRPPFNSNNLLQILGPATLFGFGMAVSRRPTPAPAFFCSETDVEESLGLPVITGVSKPKGPMFEMPPNPTHKLVIAGIRISEIIIVASVMLVVMGLVLLPDFAAHMTSNPFDAFCIGLDHLEAFFKQ